MRQILSHKNTSKISKTTGLDIVKVMVRGGTNHRKDLCLRNGAIAYLWPNGEIEFTNYKFER